MHDQVATAGGLTRQREVDPECRRNLGPTCIDVDKRDMYLRESSQQAGHAAAHHAGADNGHPVAEQRRASHRALTAVSTVPASTARAGGTPFGTIATALAGTT